MILRLFAFVSIFVSTAISTKYQKYLCSETQNVILNPDEIAFFESPNFPSILTGNDSIKCANFTITAVTPIQTDSKLVVAYTMNALNKIFYSDSYTFTLWPIFEFQNARGYVYLDEWNDDCLFESFSRINPFNIADDSLIIILKSGIFFTNLKHSCLWQFTAPEGYGFKLFINKIVLSNTTRFTVDNSEEIVATERMFKSKKAYYYRDNYIKLYFTETNFTNTINFDAYITIVKNDDVKVNEVNCSIKTENDIITWSNYNTKTGYPKNSKCSYELIIPPKTEYIVRVEYMTQIETNVDKINYYYDGNNNSRPSDIMSFPLTNIVMDAINENTSRNVLWEFISDENMQYFGFTLTFKKIECSCADPIFIVPCEGKNNYNIMKSSDSVYCGNLNCNFTILTNSICPSKLFRLEITLITQAANFIDVGEIFDVFRVISDNQTNLEINYLKRSNYNIFLSTHAHHIFQAITVSSVYTRTISISLSPVIVPPKASKITLTKNKPWHAFFLYTSEQFFTIELSPEFVKENATFQIYALSSLYNMVTFYEDETLQKEIDLRYCYKLLKTFECITNKTKMTLLIHSRPRNIVFIQSTKSVSKGCVFKNNVKMLTAEMAQKNALKTSVISNNESACQIFFMPEKQNYQIKNIWKSPSSQGVLKIYAGDLNKLVGEIEMDTINYWHDIKLNSLFYMFEIPKSSSIIIDIEDYFVDEISIFPYYSFATSPFYGLSNMTFCKDDTYTTEANPSYYPSYDIETKLTLLSFVSDPSIKVSITGYNDAIPINSTFDSMILSHTSYFTFDITIFNSTQQCGFFLEYLFFIESKQYREYLFFIESLNYNKTITSKAVVN